MSSTRYAHKPIMYKYRKSLTFRTDSKEIVNDYFSKIIVDSEAERNLFKSSMKSRKDCMGKAL